MYSDRVTNDAVFFVALTSVGHDGLHRENPMPSGPRLPIAVGSELKVSGRAPFANGDEYRAVGASPVIDLRAMHAALAVADELHFTRAAEKLNLTQSALSRQIQQLEAALAVELFRRGTRRVELTEAGSVFIRHARKTLAQAQAAIERTQAIGRGEPTEFLITYSPLIDVHLVSRMQALLTTARARTSIRAKSVAPRQQLEMLLRGNSQIAIVLMPLDIEDVETVCVLREDLLVVVPANHRLARKRQIHAAELAGEPVAWFARDLYPGFFDRVMDLLLSASYSPNLREEVQSLAEALAFVVEGERITFVKRSEARLQPPGTMMKPFADEGLQVETGLAYLTDNRSALVREVVQLLTGHFSCPDTELALARIDS